MSLGEEMPEITVIEPIKVRPLEKPAYTTTYGIYWRTWAQTNASQLRRWATEIQVDPADFDVWVRTQYDQKAISEHFKRHPFVSQWMQGAKQVQQIFDRLKKERGIL